MGSGRKHGTAWCYDARVPQTDLLFGRAETEEFVRFIMAMGAWLVPSHLNGPDVIRICDIAEFQACLDSAEKLFHIQHEDFNRCPLEVRNVRTEDGREVFYVAQRTGGPTLDLLGPYEFQENGKVRIGGGFISHYPSYWNTRTQANEAAPPAQKAFYRQLLTYIRANAVKTKAGMRTYWVGNSTATLFRQGTAALPDSWALPLEIPPG